jgi:hypothetical protein
LNCIILHSTIQIRFSHNLMYSYIFIYFPDDDLVEVETCRRDISDSLLLITDRAALFNYIVCDQAICTECVDTENYSIVLFASYVTQ